MAKQKTADQIAEQKIRQIKRSRAKSKAAVASLRAVRQRRKAAGFKIREVPVTETSSAFFYEFDQLLKIVDQVYLKAVEQSPRFRDTSFVKRASRCLYDHTGIEKAFEEKLTMLQEDMPPPVVAGLVKKWLSKESQQRELNRLLGKID